MRIVLHIAAFARAIIPHKSLGVSLTQQLANLSRSPNIKRPFALLMRMRGVNYAVRIFRRIEGAARIGHIAQHVIKRAPRRLCVLLIARDLERL